MLDDLLKHYCLCPVTSFKKSTLSREVKTVTCQLYSVTCTSLLQQYNQNGKSVCASSILIPGITTRIQIDRNSQLEIIASFVIVVMAGRWLMEQN